MRFVDPVAPGGRIQVPNDTDVQSRGVCDHELYRGHVDEVAGAASTYSIPRGGTATTGVRWLGGYRR